MVLLGRCQFLCEAGDDLLSLRTHLPASRREQQVAIGYVLDRPQEPTDLLLGGGQLRLELLILCLESIIVAFPDAPRQDRGRE